MNSSRLSIVIPIRLGLWLGLMAASLSILTGCASNQEKANQAAARADLVTESDEPDVRRRARIRLELAVGYFEQGQTNIALDELKQSIATDPNWSEPYNLRGLVYMRLNELRLAEDSFRSYELDPRNPITGYNLALLLFQRGDFVRAQFYVRRLNNSDLANAESLWLGIRVERRMDNLEAMQQLAGQLKRRFAQSPEAAAYERGAFDE